MKKVNDKVNKKDFYKISLMMLGYYIALFVLSIVSSILNYYGSRMGGDTTFCRFASIGVSTLSSLLVIIFWFVGRKQQDCLNSIMNDKVAWIMNVIIDLFELAYVCLNTIASLYNGNVIKAEFDSLIPTVSLLIMCLSAFDFIFSLFCVIAAKRKIKVQH